MYLVSLYFDEKTNHTINRWIESVAKETGNDFMTRKNVPPHMTISAFHTRKEEEVLQRLENAFGKLCQGNVTFCSVGMFSPSVIYTTPVLNRYLHEMSCHIYHCLASILEVDISQKYQPFQWFPHTTIGKTLTEEEMGIAFRLMQQKFGVFQGTVTTIGLAKPSPYEDLLRVKLQ